MTHQRRYVLVFFATACLGMVLACGGSGNEVGDTSDPAPSKQTLKQGKLKVGSPKTESDAAGATKASGTQQNVAYPLEDKAIVEEAVKRREKAIAMREEVRARNKAKRRKYEQRIKAFENAKIIYEERLREHKKAVAQHETELEEFEKAKKEYEGLRRLDFAKKLKTTAASWYRDIVRDFPDTAACKEAQRRLAGERPKTLEVPPVPREPTLTVARPTKYRPPTEPKYEDEPPIPEVPTLAEAHERRIAAEREKSRAEALRRAEEEYEVNGLVLMRKTVTGVQTEFTMVITGTVVNRRARKLSYAQITFNVYDASGAQVGNALANVNGLEPGGRWNFKAVSFTRGASYKVSQLSGF